MITHVITASSCGGESMGIVKTIAVTMIKSGAKTVINAADFDPALHRTGSTAKKKAAAPAKKGAR